MRRRNWLVIATSAALVASLGLVENASAIGYWNMPGNFCQCAGYGWGAGYHACYALGPMSCNGFCAHHEVRLPYAPKPPCYAHGCDNGGYDFRQPIHYGPTDAAPPIDYQFAPPESALMPELEMPELAPEIAPEVVPPARPLFDPPVEP